ncbi:adenylosuccinate synthetase [Vibrionales bacterium C3R12]|nr:adenylosuccinate synthetase [Vibrio sp. 03-59-1]RBW65788.1 adenylosuccinate synthetase [Vibrionales bacterium C3R12]
MKPLLFVASYLHSFIRISKTPYPRTSNALRLYRLDKIIGNLADLFRELLPFIGNILPDSEQKIITTGTKKPAN